MLRINIKKMEKITILIQEKEQKEKIKQTAQSLGLEMAPFCRMIIYNYINQIQEVQSSD